MNNTPSFKSEKSGLDSNNGNNNNVTSNLPLKKKKKVSVASEPASSSFIPASEIKRMRDELDELRNEKIPPDQRDSVTTTVRSATLPTDEASQDEVINSIKRNQDRCKNDTIFWRDSTVELLEVTEVYREKITELEDIVAFMASECEELVMKVKSLQAQLKEQASQKVSDFEDMVEKVKLLEAQLKEEKSKMKMLQKDSLSSFSIAY